MKYQLAVFTAILLFLTSCFRLPEKKLSQAGGNIITYEVANDSIKIRISNSLNCPLRISASSPNEAVQKKIGDDFPLTIGAHKKILFTYWTNKSKEEVPIQFSAMMGNPNDSIYKKEINLPFQKGSKFKIIQGYNGSFSHSSEYSRYALDFNLMEGDTVCAAADGFVVGVIEGYIRGGKSKRWRDYANYITIFHPEMNLYTQYVHLMHNGSLVAVGDYVKAEQVIGLSGKTGYTDVEHLHFNVLQPNATGMESTPINFKEGYHGDALTKGDSVKK